MRRHDKAVRVLAAGGALAGALTLAACDKPVPKITVQQGSFVTTIRPSTYCFDRAHCRDSAPQLPVVASSIDGKVLVDVPHALVSKGWAVTALSLDGTKALGGSGAIRDSHSYRIAASTNNGNPFIVQVNQLDKGRSDGSKWSFLVKVTQS